VWASSGQLDGRGARRRVTGLWEWESPTAVTDFRRCNGNAADEHRSGASQMRRQNLISQEHFRRGNAASYLYRQGSTLATCLIFGVQLTVLNASSVPPSVGVAA
jgi:hypothetical protein